MNIYLQEIVNISNHSKYLKWYVNIITSATQRATTKRLATLVVGYTERHHILPVCLCSTSSQKKDKQNIAYLTAREHFLCHWLLTKIINHPGLVYGMYMLGKRCNNSKHYELIRKQFSSAMSNLKLSYSAAYQQSIAEKYKKTMVDRYGKDYATAMNPMLNKNHTEVSKSRISLNSKNLVHSAKTKTHLSEIRSKVNGNASLFRIVTPTGEEFITGNLLQFCNDNNIAYSTLNQNKDGYQLVNLKPAKWRILSATKEMLVHSLKEFCNENGLNYSTAYSHYKNSTPYYGFTITSV